MASYREIVYLVLDEIKSLNGDSTITEEHVIFLANHYRTFLLDLKVQKQGILSLSESNELTLCLNLLKVNAIPGLEYCNDQYLRSVLKIPNTIGSSIIKVYPSDYFNSKITFVSRNRFKYIGYNRYMLNITYCTLGPDNYLYLKSNNPQFLYLKNLKATGIFENSQEAGELACDSKDTNKCDTLDLTFPLESDLIPSMIELIVKELYGAQWRLADNLNNSTDDVANLIAYLLKNTKSALAKLLSE